MDKAFRQSSPGVRLEWGAAGAAALAPGCAALVVVDVLSFTTSVCVAAEAGTRVFPCPRDDDTAGRLAREMDAERAVGRRAASPRQPWSLSPAALRRAPAPARLVLPSPNGSAIAAAAARSAAGAGPAADGSTPAGPVIVAACLRNAAAAARWLAGRGIGTLARPAAVIAAGEQWPDGSLRPALEDLLGAGAVVAALRDAGAGPLSPEAAAAAACFTAPPDISAAIAACASGAELYAAGFAEDVAIAAAVASCRVVPVLQPGPVPHDSDPNDPARRDVT
jgi:2-phosphosulfolactate phosphatase